VFRRVSSFVKNIPKVRGIWQRLALKSLYHLAGLDWPPWSQIRRIGGLSAKAFVASEVLRNQPHHCFRFTK
jgi:hypothetical protein